jgi:hypothetical protein
MFGSGWVHVWERVRTCLGAGEYMFGSGWVNVWERVSECLGAGEWMFGSGWVNVWERVSTCLGAGPPETAYGSEGSTQFGISVSRSFAFFSWLFFLWTLHILLTCLSILSFDLWIRGKSILDYVLTLLYFISNGIHINKRWDKRTYRW